ncbi:MAG: hypothetical protein E4G96_01990 [Chrysiogenales bacterium]|nr:MAG: hypothetical protein E4G96_01990 [Chrysiogenales bacterium]
MARGAMFAVAIVISLTALSCGGMKGEFGFKMFGQDTYRHATGTPEFPADEEIAWVYHFHKKYGEREIGVVYQKKELVWIEVFSRSERIDNTNRTIYGSIKGLSPGEYRIILTETHDDNRLVGSADFIIYEREEEE